jgi:hypothetical protein
VFDFGDERRIVDVGHTRTAAGGDRQADGTLSPPNHAIELMTRWTLAGKPNLFWILAVALTGVLVYQQFALGAANRQLRKRMLANAAPVVAVGDQMGGLTGFGLSAERVTENVFTPTGKFLVIGISARCGFCVQNVPVWKRVLEAAGRSGVRVIWVSRDPPQETGEFFAAHFETVDGTVIAEPTHSTHTQMKLSAVPQTVLVGASGIVAGVWGGVLDGPAEAKLLRAIE